MSMTSEDSILIGKIRQLVQKLRCFLQEIGCSEKQKASYFAQSIFDVALPSVNLSSSQLYAYCIKEYLQTKLIEKKSLHIALVHLIAKIEIEIGKIENYENNVSEKISVKHQELKIDELNLEKQFRMQRLFELEPSIEQPAEDSKMLLGLQHIKSFQKQLQESLMKTKILKRIIEQRVAQQSEQPLLGLTRYQKLLALGTSG